MLWRHTFTQRIHDAWYRGHPLLVLLLPFSLLFRGAVALRRLYYQKCTHSVIKFPVPVIVVGNITFGGTGKTPLVIWLARVLKTQGYQPGIVSRGYGGHSSFYPCHVMSDSDPATVGDEALLLARNTECPMVVAPSRVKAIQKLLADYSCDVVISDDGLQHYAMGRDIEIAVQDGARRIGNGHCLPAGPLREPSQRLSQVDWVVTQGEAQNQEIAMQLRVGDVCSVASPAIKIFLKELQGKVLHAVAGIGNPQRFFNLLNHLGLTIIAHPFPDHHQFSLQDLQFGEDAVVIMTEKDAVKCQKFALSKWWYLSVEAVLPQEFKKEVLKKVSGFAPLARGSLRIT